jgi:F-type H+-transporting ATPase subunit gamma
LVVGTERGLCGKFNQSLAENAIEWIGTQNFSSHQIWAMGSRIIREMEREGVHISWRTTLPTSELPSYQRSYLTTQNWLEQYEDYAFNQLIILFNQTSKSVRYEFSTFKLLPYEMQHPHSVTNQATKHWPPPIIETEPIGIYQHVIEHYIAASFYQTLLKSAVAEHSSRHNMMQEAEDNAEDIIAEVQAVLNQERKRKITQEMQELASGSGLLDN